MTVGPNQIGSDRGQDCPHGIQSKEVRGRVQEGEGELLLQNDLKLDVDFVLEGTSISSALRMHTIFSKKELNQNSLSN